MVSAVKRPQKSPSRSKRLKQSIPAPKAGRRQESAAKKPETGLTQLEQMPVPELLALARNEGVEEVAGLNKQQLIVAIVNSRAKQGHTIHGQGTLQVLPEGYGFLRMPACDYQPSPKDIYVSPAEIRRLGLKSGMTVAGLVRPPSDTQRNFTMQEIQSVNGADPEKAAMHIPFDDLTPLHPDERLCLETEAEGISMRVVDLATPIGKGQRGLIVSPPRAGKTILLQKMAMSILQNHPECYVIVLLIDERPEEVTEMRQNVAGPNAEVIASTFDEPADRHTQVAEIVLAKAKRMVEFGKDVVILLDSITRLARAYNTVAPTAGKTLTGGISVGALQNPKRFFGAARSIEGGGSLTILATALIDTGSRMDDVIFEEFKGTGNMEIHLDRRLVDKRIWPAVDINSSGTRREELLLHPDELRRIWMLRKAIADLNPADAVERLSMRLAKFKSNAEFLMSVAPDGER